VAGAFRQLCLPAGDLVAHALEVSQRHVTERGDGVSQPLT
jgi:hypothetical protein